MEIKFDPSKRSDLLLVRNIVSKLLERKLSGPRIIRTALTAAQKETLRYVSMLPATWTVKELAAMQETPIRTARAQLQNLAKHFPKKSLPYLIEWQPHLKKSTYKTDPELLQIFLDYPLRVVSDKKKNA